MYMSVSLFVVHSYMNMYMRRRPFTRWVRPFTLLRRLTALAPAPAPAQDGIAHGTGNAGSEGLTGPDRAHSA